MQTLIQLLKSKTVLFALFLAVLSILQGYVNLLPLSPTDQMFVGNLCKLGICKKLPGKDRSIRPVYINFRNIE